MPTGKVVLLLFSYPDPGLTTFIESTTDLRFIDLKV